MSKHKMIVNLQPIFMSLKTTVSSPYWPASDICSPGKSDRERGGDSPRSGEEVKEEDKDPATKAKEKLAQRIDMYKVCHWASL